MSFSEIYSIFFLDGFFHILYLFEKSEIFMPHPVVYQLILRSKAPDEHPQSGILSNIP